VLRLGDGRSVLSTNPVVQGRSRIQAQPDRFIPAIVLYDAEDFVCVIEVADVRDSAINSLATDFVDPAEEQFGLVLRHAGAPLLQASSAAKSLIVSGPPIDIVLFS
jgi:hypothetical protein